MIPQDLLTFFQDQSSLYRLKEIGDGTHDFTKKVLESIFGLAPKSSIVPETSLFGEVLYDNFYIYEGSKKQGASARWDFRCKINGQLVVIETEKLDNIEAGMKQIGGYMQAENTNYGIVTDGGIWRFFKDGADHLDQYITLTIEELCSDNGKAFLQNFYNTYVFYLQRLSSIESKPFDTQVFHQGLITTAERIVFDLRHIGLFTGDTQHIAKQEIQTTYSLIIQLLLIKIIQDKRKINLLKKDVIVEKLKKEDRNGIFEAVESQIKRLGDFYKPYHNQQDSLLNTIITHYQKGSRIAKLNLDSIRLFLDVYYFIYAFDFTKVQQDLFGAVYENYLKELYKDDDTKKGQVFTPPEIVEFMLDEVGYTVEYIGGVIQHNLNNLKAHLDDHHYNIDGLSLIDPACGSGTFLYKSAGRIVNAILKLKNQNLIDDMQAGKIAELLICNNIVGFDIEPFPLYLAEMNILQWLLFFNVSADGTVINSIDQPIKIFSTDDSIAEFHNLDVSMKNDIESMKPTMSLFTKRDNEAILSIKADLQDWDPKYFTDTIKFEKGLEEIQKDKYLIQDTTLLTKENKSFWNKHSKTILKKCTTMQELRQFIKSIDANLYKIFEKNYSNHYDLYFAEIETKLTTLQLKSQTKRTKFDFVVANPPYVNMKNTKDRGTTIYGYDINDPKRKTIKTTGDYLNIYAYFYYLGIFLLKNNGKLCFITPRDIIYKTAMNKTKRFLKEISSIKKVIDFNNAALFYNRGISGNNIVGTTSVILLLEKNQEKGDIEFIKYNGEENLLDFVLAYQKETKKRAQAMSVNTIPYDDLFDDSIETNQESLISYLHATFGKDLCITTYPKLWKNSDPKAIENFNKVDASILSHYPSDGKNRFLNQEKKGYFYFSNSNDYLLPGNNSKLYYDINKLGTWIPYRTGIEVEDSVQGNTRDGDKNIRILNKQIKILIKQIRINREYHYHTNKKFSFSDDYKIISDQGNKMAIGISDFGKIDEIYFLLGILNSSYIGNIIIQKYGSICNQKNIEQLPVPLLNTPIKLALKSDLIANSQAIITLCKHGTSGGISTRGDICETVWDPDSLGEKIIGLKAQYSHLGILIPDGVQISDTLPDDVLSVLKTDTNDLTVLEQQRDEIVRQLYELE